MFQSLHPLPTSCLDVLITMTMVGGLRRSVEGGRIGRVGWGDGGCRGAGELDVDRRRRNEHQRQKAMTRKQKRHRTR